MLHSTAPTNPDPAHPEPASHNLKADPEDGAVAEITECSSCGLPAATLQTAGKRPIRPVANVIGGSFRALVNVENGFWPTFVGLTLRPERLLAGTWMECGLGWQALGATHARQVGPLRPALLFTNGWLVRTDCFGKQDRAARGRPETTDTGRAKI